MKKKLIGDYEYTMCKSGDVEIIETGEGYGYILIERGDRQDAALALLGGLTSKMRENTAIAIAQSLHRVHDCKGDWVDYLGDARTVANAALKSIFGEG